MWPASRTVHIEHEIEWVARSHGNLGLVHGQLEDVSVSALRVCRQMVPKGVIAFASQRLNRFEIDDLHDAS
jgi:hypothetical protein